MSVIVPHNISDLSITFFARSKPYEVQKSHKNFDTVRTVLLGWGAETRSESDLDTLIALADPREEIRVASNGKLEFLGSQLVYGGAELHNLWADKIIAFKDKGEVYDPIFAALEDLQHNPTPAARERLPIFVERSKLGFLPDGRIAAFKGVRDNFNDVHSNTVNYAVGKTVSIPREACNADPNQTCVAGLHVGAIDYIKEMGYGWGRDRRMLLVAFWPRHAVAVPTDYRGGKMRVEQLEVLDEVDRKYVDELLNNGTTIVRGYEPSPHGYSAPLTPAATATAPAALEAYQKAKVGDWIMVEGDSDVNDGEHLVVNIDDDEDADYRIEVRQGVDEANTIPIDNDAVVTILNSAPLWFTAKVGDWIEDDSSYFPKLVIEIDADEYDPDGQRVRAQSFDGGEWIDSQSINKILETPPAVWLRVRDEDIVRIEGHDFLRDGEYRAISVEEYDSIEGDGRLITIETGTGDEFEIRNDSIKSIKREEEEASAVAEAEKPVHEKAKIGDFIRVDKGVDHPAGIFEVTNVGTSSYHRLAINYEGRNGGVWYIKNEKVVEIVPAFKRAKIGDTIRIENGRQRDGNYVVDHIDDKVDTYDRRLRVKNPSGVAWVDDRSVVEVIEALASTAPAVSSDPVWKQAKVGDTIRVDGGSRHNGNYVVDQVDASNGMGRRLRVKNPGGYVWVDNSSVREIVTVEAWKQAKEGDVIKVEGSRWASDGEYTVKVRAREEHEAGYDYSYGPQITTGFWIERGAVKSIVKVA